MPVSKPAPKAAKPTLETISETLSNPDADDDSNIGTLEALLPTALDEIKRSVRPFTDQQKLAAPSSSIAVPPLYSKPVDDKTLSDGLKPPLAEAAGRANAAFAQLVRGWESYMNDANVEAFPSLQMLTNLQMCGNVSEGMRITGSAAMGVVPEDEPLAQPELRHTHSTPLKYGRSMFEADNGEYVPPAIPLDPFLRSSSTPSSFRHQSLTSAFVLPSHVSSAHRASYTSSIINPRSMASAFDPVMYYSMALEDMERTSIEVTADMAHTPAPDISLVPQDSSEAESRGPASRAAKFLSDVKLLRRRRVRNGRENPAQPPSVLQSPRDEGAEEGGVGVVMDTAVTVFTESGPNFNATLMLSGSSEMSGAMNTSTFIDNCISDPSTPNNMGDCTEEAAHPTDHYTHHDYSNPEEEELKFHRVHVSLDSSESQGSVPSPSYHQIENDRPGAHSETNRVRVFTLEKIDALGLDQPVASPSQNLFQDSQSPRSMCFRTGSTPCEVTTVKLLSTTTTPLYTISETDREVMLANKEGKKRRSLDSAVKSYSNALDICSESVNSGSTSSSNPNGYFALAESPISLREGANVPTDRFFDPTVPTIRTQSTTSVRFNIPLTTIRSGHSGSSGTLETSSATNTTGSLSGSSVEEKPPSFVSTLERQGASDLTSFREVTECSSQRGNADSPERREESPVELAIFPSVVFEARAVGLSADISGRESRGRPDKDKMRNRPPRSPAKGNHHATPPPDSPFLLPLDQHSPPRNIVDHPMPNMDPSRPYVVRTPCLVGSSILHSTATLPTNPVSPLHFHEGAIRGRTYHDGSVEILKDDAKSDESPIVTSRSTPSYQQR
jgi:hypothetical protein